MGRFTGILGLLAMLGLAYAFSTNRRAIRLKTVAWGLGLQFAFAVAGVEGRCRAASFSESRGRGEPSARLLVRWLAVRFRRSWKARFPSRILFRFSGAADHYFHLRIFRRALSLRRDAVRD